MLPDRNRKTWHAIFHSTAAVDCRVWSSTGIAPQAGPSSCENDRDREPLNGDCVSASICVCVRRSLSLSVSLSVSLSLSVCLPVRMCLCILWCTHVCVSERLSE